MQREAVQEQGRVPASPDPFQALVCSLDSQGLALR